MKWWKKSENRLIFVKWNKLKCSLYICENIFMSEDNCLRERFTSRGKKHHSTVLNFWENEERFLDKCANLGHHTQVSHNIFDKNHLSCKGIKPRRIDFFIKFSTRENSIKSCKIHTMSE